MAVNRFIQIFFFSIIVTYIQAKPTHDYTTQFIDKQVIVALNELGKKTEDCNKIKEKNNLNISIKELHDLNITREQFTSATMTLHYKNDKLCVSDKESAFIYQYLLQYKDKKEKGILEKDALEPMLIILPSNEVLESLSKYEKLPINVKNFFKKKIGDTPFDIIKVSLPILEAFRK